MESWQTEYIAPRMLAVWRYIQQRQQLSERLSERSVLVLYFASLNIHRAEPTIQDQKEDKHQWWFAVGLFFDRSKHHIHHSGRQQLPIRATLSDFGGALIWIKIIACELRNLERSHCIGRRIYSLCLCCLSLEPKKEVLVHQPTMGSLGHSIHVDLTYYLQIVHPDDMGFR